MTEPYTGPAPDLNSPEGTQTQPQLAPEQQAGNGPTPPSGEPAQPSVEDLQRRAAEYEKRFTDTQQAYTQSQQELARLRNLTQQLVGNQVQPPQQNPVDRYAAELAAKSKAYDPQMVRDVAEMQWRMTQDAIAPLQQQAQMAQQTANIDYSIQQAAQQWPQLFTSQQEYNEARQAAQYIVQNGGVPDPRTIAAVVNDNRFFRQPNGTPPAAMQPAPPVAQPFANGMYQTRPGFTQPSYQSAPQQMTPDQQVAENFIKSYLKKP